jgi:hypothetical protein
LNPELTLDFGFFIGTLPSNDAVRNDSEIGYLTRFSMSTRMKFGATLGIPVKVNADSGGKPNGIPERR